MTEEEALKKFAYPDAVWFGNSAPHFAFSAYCRPATERTGRVLQRLSR